MILPLPVVYRLLVDSFPDFRFSQNTGEFRLRSRNSPSETRQEPFQPRGNIHPSPLAMFQMQIVLLPLGFNLLRHAVESFDRSLGPRQGHVGYRPANAPVAILEGMDCDEPKMGDSSL